MHIPETAVHSKLSRDKRPAAYFHNDFLLGRLSSTWTTGNSPSGSVCEKERESTVGRKGRRTLRLTSDNRIKSRRRRRERNAKSFKERNFNLCNIRYFGFSAVPAMKRERDGETVKQTSNARRGLGARGRDGFNQLGERAGCDDANNCMAGKSFAVETCQYRRSCAAVLSRLPIVRLGWGNYVGRIKRNIEINVPT